MGTWCTDPRLGLIVAGCTCVRYARRKVKFEEYVYLRMLEQIPLTTHDNGVKALDQGSKDTEFSFHSVRIYYAVMGILWNKVTVKQKLHG